MVNTRQFEAVPAQLLRFTKARDPKTGALVEVRGLVNRRMAEVALWKTADVGAAETIAATAATHPPPSGFMRLSDTPPEPMAVKPLARSKSFWASVSAAAAAVGSALLQVVEPAAHGARTAVDAISPFADGSSIVTQWRSLLLATAAGLALAAPLLIALKNHKGRVQ